MLDIHLKISVVTTGKNLMLFLDKLDIHLKISVVTTHYSRPRPRTKLDIHLKISVVTTCRLKSDEFQLYIGKIK